MAEEEKDEAENEYQVFDMLRMSQTSFKPNKNSSKSACKQSSYKQRT